MKPLKPGMSYNDLKKSDDLKVKRYSHPDHERGMAVLNTLEDHELDHQPTAVKALKDAGLHSYSKTIESMHPNEYSDYVTNHVAEADEE